MNLTNKQVQDFIDAWQADFGETLSHDVAKAEANRLWDFFVQMEEDLRSQRTQARQVEPSSGDALHEAWKQMMKARRS